MIIIEFDNFKQFVEDNNKRIYYYQIGSILEMYCITEGIFVMSFVNINEIENKEMFFSHQIFLGATKLLFSIKSRHSSEKGIQDLRTTSGIITEYVSAELENTDIQKEGIKE